MAIPLTQSTSDSSFRVMGMIPVPFVQQTLDGSIVLYVVSMARGKIYCVDGQNNRHE